MPNLFLIDRIQAPNSTPRCIGLMGLGCEGEQLRDGAVAAGVVATILELDDLPIHKQRPEKATDLNTIIVVCGGTSNAPGIERIYQWATEIGVLVTAVVVCPIAAGVSVAMDLSVLRAHCDMLTITTDEEYLPTMLQWLGKAG